MTNIKEIRKRLGVTQKELSKSVGVTPACVCNWENGTSQPRTADLPRIADALGVTIDELLREPEEGT